MSWFRRDKPKIEDADDDAERIVKTEGIFVKCPECENALYKRELNESHEVCTHCGYHFRYSAIGRLKDLFDDGRYRKTRRKRHFRRSARDLLIQNLTRIVSSRRRQVSGLPEAIVSGKGMVGGHLRLCRCDGYGVHRRFDGFGRW